MKEGTNESMPSFNAEITLRTNLRTEIALRANVRTECCILEYRMSFEIDTSFNFARVVVPFSARGPWVESIFIFKRWNGPHSDYLHSHPEACNGWRGGMNAVACRDTVASSRTSVAQTDVLFLK